MVVVVGGGRNRNKDLIQISFHINVIVIIQEPFIIEGTLIRQLLFFFMTPNSNSNISSSSSKSKISYNSILNFLYE